MQNKAASFTKARVKERIRYHFGAHLIRYHFGAHLIRYHFGVHLIPEASSFKYLGTIICNELNSADHVNYTPRKAWRALHFIMRILKKGNNNTKHLAYTAIVRPILEYGSN